MKNIVIVFVFLTILACNPCRYVAKHTECFQPDSVLITETINQHDSIITVLPDTSLITALFECDSNSNVLIKELNEKNTGIKTKIIFKDNKLSLQIYTDSLEILNKIIEKQRSKKVSKINPVNEKLLKVNKKLEKKVKIRNYFVYYAMILTLLIIVWLFIKNKIKIFQVK